MTIMTLIRLSTAGRFSVSISMTTIITGAAITAVTPEKENTIDLRAGGFGRPFRFTRSTPDCACAA
jgi:hypothetical protein